MARLRDEQETCSITKMNFITSWEQLNESMKKGHEIFSTRCSIPFHEKEERKNALVSLTKVKAQQQCQKELPLP